MCVDEDKSAWQRLRISAKIWYFFHLIIEMLEIEIFGPVGPYLWGERCLENKEMRFIFHVIKFSGSYIIQGSVI